MTLDERYLLQQNLTDLESDAAPVVVLEAQGRLFRASVAGWAPFPCACGCRRGRVGGFSARSRKRLLEKLARLEHDPSSVSFVTLTYPQQFPTPQRAKQHLRAWLKRLQVRFPDVAAVWRLELQQRGAPHFHLIIFGASWIDKRWIQKSWSEVIGWAGVPVFTRIERLRSWRGVMSYASKYIAKVSDVADAPRFATEVPDVQAGDWGAVTVLTGRAVGFNSLPYLAARWDFVGRWWGVFNEAGLPYADKSTVVVPFGGWFEELKSAGLLVWSGVNAYRGQGFTLFMDEPSMLVELGIKLAEGD